MTQENASMDRLVKMLQSNNPNVRYEACEELRVAPSIPKEALAALRKATQDSDPNVVDAATRAVALHTAQTEERMTQENAPTPNEPKQSFFKNFPFGFLSITMFLIFFFNIMTSQPGNPLWYDSNFSNLGPLICVASPIIGIIFAGIGWSLDRKSKIPKAAIIIWVVGGCLTIFMALLICASNVCM